VAFARSLECHTESVNNVNRRQIKIAFMGVDIEGGVFSIYALFVALCCKYRCGQKGWDCHCHWNQNEMKAKSSHAAKMLSISPWAREKIVCGNWGGKGQPTINIETVIAAKSFHALFFFSIAMPVTVTVLPETEIAALTSYPQSKLKPRRPKLKLKPKSKSADSFWLFDVWF